MYDWPEIAWAADALWCAIAERLNAAGIAAPAALDRSPDAGSLWRNPGLVLSQVCGFPVATSLRHTVQPVATPIYGVEGSDGPTYSSFIVTRSESGDRALADFAGRRVAFNVIDSLSGRIALLAAMREEGLTSEDVEWIETGGHRESICAVAEGLADLAAIDSLCLALARSFEPEAVSRVKVIGQTPPRPAPPFITLAGRSAAELDILRTALSSALASAETEQARNALRIDGVAVLTLADYDPIADLVPWTARPAPSRASRG